MRCQQKRGVRGIVALQRLVRARQLQARCTRDQGSVAAAAKRAQDVAYRKQWHGEVMARLRRQQYVSRLTPERGVAAYGVLVEMGWATKTAWPV